MVPGFFVGSKAAGAWSWSLCSYLKAWIRMLPTSPRMPSWHAQGLPYLLNLFAVSLFKLFVVMNHSEHVWGLGTPWLY